MLRTGEGIFHKFFEERRKKEVPSCSQFVFKKVKESQILSLDIWRRGGILTTRIKIKDSQSQKIKTFGKGMSVKWESQI